MASSSRKRFISGAVCPGCGAVDKVFVIEDGSGARRGCTQCDFSENLEDAVSAPEPGVQVVKLPGGADS